MLGQIARLGQNWIDGSDGSGLAPKGPGLEGKSAPRSPQQFHPRVEPGRPSPNPLLLQGLLQPTVIRICTDCRDWNRCPCRKVGGVNLVRLERSLAHQWLVGVPQGAGIIRTGVTVGSGAARGHDEKKGRCNEQSYLINP
jgi:hypothetical protein